MNTPAKIDQVLSESGLTPEQQKDNKAAYLPYLQKISETIEKAKGINRENPTEEDEKLARELRLSLVPNRTAARKFKMTRTEKLRLVKNLEDASYRLIENESKLVELELREVEYHVANKRAAELNALRDKRETEVREYIDNPEIYPLGEMTQEQFDKFIEDQKLAKGAREKMEQEARAKEDADRKEAVKEQARKDKEAKRLATENKKLKAEADKKLAEANKKATEAAKKIVHDLLIKIKSLTKQLVADGWVAKTPDLYAKRGHEISSQMLSEHSQATLEAFMKLTNKEIQEEAKIKAAADIKNSSDQTQLLSWVDTMHLPDVSLTTAEGKAVLKDIEKKFNGFKKWAESEILKLK